MQRAPRKAWLASASLRLELLLSGKNEADELLYLALWYLRQSRYTLIQEWIWHVTLTCRVQETCLSCIPDMVSAASELFEAQRGMTWHSCEPAVGFLRSILAPAVENASAGYLLTEQAKQAGIGKALDRVLAEAVAGGLASVASRRFLHLVLGTCLRFTMLR